MDILTTFELLGSTTGAGMAYMAVSARGYGLGYWRIKDRDLRVSHRDAAYVRRTWRRLAQHVGLVLKDDFATTMRQLASKNGKVNTRIQVPRLIRIETDRHGLVMEFRPVAGVGLDEFAKEAKHLADYWGMTRLSITQPEARVIRVRAVRTDPLTRKLLLAGPTHVPSHLEFVPIGLDDYAERVSIQLAQATGIGIYGAPRRGKTSLILGFMTALAAYEEVQFVLADGKTANGFDGDYFDMANRCVAVIGDSIAQYNALIKEVKALREARQKVIRQELGTPNFWDVGPSKAWPVVIVVIDEAHSYFKQIKPDGGDKAIKDQNALAAENAWLTEDVVKKCGSVGIFFVIATQKPTVDAIPSAIRDNLTHGLCLGVRTDAVAVAALGEDIKDYPEASPLQFMRKEFQGCASMVSEDTVGFVRFRTPYCSPQLAAKVASDTKHLVAQRIPFTIGRAHLEALPDTPGQLLELEKPTEN